MGFTAASFSCRNDPSFILVPCFVGGEDGYRCTPDDAPETEPSPLDCRMDEADAKPPPPPLLPFSLHSAVNAGDGSYPLAANGALSGGSQTWIRGVVFFIPFQFSCSSCANGKKPPMARWHNVDIYFHKWRGWRVGVNNLKLSGVGWVDALEMQTATYYGMLEIIQQLFDTAPFEAL